MIADDFKDMNLRERLELLGIAVGMVFEPIEALSYTQEELESRKKETFLLNEVVNKQNGEVRYLQT